MKAVIRVILALGCSLALGAGVWAAALQPAIRWSVLGSGGGPAQSASYRLNGTLGQALVGASSGATVRLSAGYWAGLAGAESPTPTTSPTVTSSPTATGTATPTPTATGTTTAVPTATGTVAPSETPWPTATLSGATSVVNLPLIVRQ